MSDIRIEHQPTHQRFEALEDGRPVGQLSYADVGGVLDLRSTVVDPSMRGRGLGGELVEAALQHARAEGRTVRPTCPYVPRYLADHPEHQDLVAD